jgi:hypothetical protein
LTEARFTARLLNDVRRARPGAVVWKIADRFTGGIPDFLVCEEGRTTFCEVKLLGAPSSRSKLFVPLQLEMCKRMRAWYIFWSVPLREGYLFRADEMNASYAWMNFAEPLTYAELVEQIRRTF